MAAPSERPHEPGEGAKPLVEAMPTEQRIGPLERETNHQTDGKPSSRSDPPPPPPRRPWRKWLWIIGGLVGVGIALFFLIPWAATALNTVSTDDAYVHGHVTMVAPRVAGQVARVLVENNMRVRKGDLLIELDKEPNKVQVAIKQAAVTAAEADLTAARAQVRSLLALARAQRWQLQTSMDQVASQVANLNASYATYKSRLATLELARSNLKRGQELRTSGGLSQEELELRRQTVKVDEAQAEQALEAVQAIRVGLGLPQLKTRGPELAEVAPELEQTFPGVRTALANLVQTVTQIGLPLPSTNATPRQVLDEFRSRDVGGNIDKIVEDLIPSAPQVKQAEAKLLQTRRDLDQALLNLKYCDIVSEIDGAVTGRNVNPGNNVQVGQSLMAVRSLTEIWVDANFKETQLGYLRIGQRVRCEVDMYGRHREYEGRISGFTMGTGQTLSLLPPENATGNFVKIVQRLPVRIELTNYEPNWDPLFVGLSVVPYVYYKEPAAGPSAGEMLQPYAPLPTLPAVPKP